MCYMRQITHLTAALFLCVSHFDAQSGSTTQDLTFQVSSAQPWTDTGLDLQPGDVLQISAAAAPAPDPNTATGTPSCDPNGVSASAGHTSDLPLPVAIPGALIARLHAHGASPLLVGASTELRIEGPSHLFLGMNGANTFVCQGGLTVKVHRTPAGSAAGDASASVQNPTSNSGASAQTASSAPGAAEGQKTRGEQLKSQLSTAAQVFMSGQFGMGKPESDSNSGASNAVSSGSSSSEDATAAAPPLKVSDSPLDADLRKSLDSLPRRVNDQFQNLGDMVNFVIVGSLKDVQAALDAATWHVADTNNGSAVLSAVMQTYEKKDYLQMPMSTLYLFGRKQDFGYEMAEPIAMVASRHHFRIWKAPFTWRGQEVWVGAGTHDIGFAKDKRNGNVTHKIDPSVDGERDNIGSSLQKANKTKTMSYYLPPNPVQDAKNATGDGYHSDGRLLVMILQ